MRNIVITFILQHTSITMNHKNILIFSTENLYKYNMYVIYKIF